MIQARTITYLSILLTGWFFCQSFPFFALLGVGPQTFFTALFLDYFGWQVSLLLFLVPKNIMLLPSIQGYYELVAEQPIFKSNPLGVTVGLILFVEVFACFLVRACHKTFHKVGVYRRFNFGMMTT